MAKYTSAEFVTTNPWVKYKIILETGNPNIEANTTPATVRVHAYRTNTGYVTYGDGKCYCTIDGTKHEQKIHWNTQQITENGVDLFKESVVIKHDSDGSKKLTISAYFVIDTVVSSSPQSETFTLDTIPRASTMSFDGEFTIGEIVNFAITRASEAFTHKLFCVIAGVETMIAESVKESYLWDTGKWKNGYLWKASEFSDGFLYGSIRIYTFVGSTNVGSKDYPFTATVPNEYEGEPVAPSVFFEIEPYNDVLDETWESLRDNYIASISKVKLDFSGSYVNPGIGFGSYVIQIDGVIKGMQTDSEHVEFITNTAFLTSGSHVIRAIVRDKSGMESASEKIVTVDPYLPPFVSPASGYPVAQRVERTDDGNYVPSYRGESVMIRAILNFTELENNNQAKMEYQIKGGASGLCQEINGNDMDFGTADKSMASFVIPDQQFPFDRSFSISLFATDRIGRGNDYVVTVPVATPTAHAADDGRGIAFGMLAEGNNKFQCNYESYFYSPLFLPTTNGFSELDYVIERGQTSAGWTYEIRKSGLATCTGKITESVTTSQMVNVWAGEGGFIEFPIEFDSPPIVFANSLAPNYCTPTIHEITKFGVSFYYITVSGPLTNKLVPVCIHASGKIKKENE